MHEERISHSPHIQFVWRSYAEKAGSFNDIAHDFWVLAFRELQEKTEVRLTGPVTEPYSITYEAGQQSWGIVFKAHVFILGLKKKDLLNKSKPLPAVEDGSFRIGDHIIQVPTFETAEVFVDELINKSIISANMDIAKALEGEKPPMSDRTLQRHYLNTTGITQNKSFQIERARKAFLLLQDGASIVEAAYDLGYADQAHLTRSLKLLAGQTPRQIILSSTKS